jgi:triosephosphate isomerase
MTETLFIANWKLNHNISSTEIYIDKIKTYQNNNAKIIICPPFPLINNFNDRNLTNISFGAQNIAANESGAFTGEVHAELLQELNCHYAIIGHSERREFFNEKDNDVNKKIKIALKHNITPILCIGETKSERESNAYLNVITKQLELALFEVNISGNIIIAYEPIWSIGTGLIPDNKQIEEVFNSIIQTTNRLNIENNKIKILYGGSANVKNLASLIEIPNISGFLIGSASLDAENLMKMADFVK